MRIVLIFFYLLTVFNGTSQPVTYEQLAFNYFVDNLQLFSPDTAQTSPPDTLVLVIETMDYLKEDHFQSLSKANTTSIVAPNRYTKENIAQNCSRSKIYLRMPDRKEGPYFVTSGKFKKIRVTNRFYYDDFVYVYVVATHEDDFLSSKVLFKFDKHGRILDKYFYQFFH